MPNFSSLARLEVPEKFVWVVGGGWGLQSHFHVKPNRCVEVRLRLGWGFDNNQFIFSSYKMQKIRTLTKHNALPKFLSS